MQLMSLQLAPMATGAGDLPPAVLKGGQPAQVHVVQAGETLISICEYLFGHPCFGARTLGRALLSANF